MNTTTEKGWTCDTGDGKSPYVVRDSDGDARAEFLIRHDAERYVRDRNRAVGIGETGDAHAEVAESMRSRMDEIGHLIAVANGDVDTLPQQAVEALEIGAEYDDHELQDERGLEDNARERLHEYPLAVERTIEFEVVLGTGGPDDRLVFQCSVNDGQFDQLELERVLYRYSWTGSAEVELTGQDRENAEAFAREVVGDLSEAI